MTDSNVTIDVVTVKYLTELIKLQAVKQVIREKMGRGHLHVSHEI